MDSHQGLALPMKPQESRLILPTHGGYYRLAYWSDRLVSRRPLFIEARRE
jgi:hypothetical protein